MNNRIYNSMDTDLKVVTTTRRYYNHDTHAMVIAYYVDKWNRKNSNVTICNKK